MGCELCAGVAASQALKILLNRGDVLAAPHGLQYDDYLNKLRHTWRPGGNRNPLQRLTLALARERLAAERPPVPAPVTGRVYEVLDLARWAPSGDNAQPWRFEVLGNNKFAVHSRPSGDIYDLHWHPRSACVGCSDDRCRPPR